MTKIHLERKFGLGFKVVTVSFTVENSCMEINCTLSFVIKLRFPFLKMIYPLNPFRLNRKRKTDFGVSSLSG